MGDLILEILHAIERDTNKIRYLVFALVWRTAARAGQVEGKRHGARAAAVRSVACRRRGTGCHLFHFHNLNKYNYNVY